jgi:prepilin-type processing-associated H-X9-DG protein
LFKKSNKEGAMRQKKQRINKKIKQRVFTLVELLIIIAIIAILASLLMPALSKARNRGKSVVCQNNLKQIFLAEMSYAGDYSWFTAGCSYPNELFKQDYWSQKLRPYLGSTTVPTSWDEENGLRKIPPLWCPSTEPDGRDTSSYAESTFGCLAAWFNLRSSVMAAAPGTAFSKEIPRYIRPYAKADGISNSQILFISELGSDPNDSKYPTYHSIRNGTYFEDIAGNVVGSWRHDNKKNVLFLDGHIGQVTPGEMDYSLYLP